MACPPNRLVITRFGNHAIIALRKTGKICANACIPSHRRQPLPKTSERPRPRRARGMMAMSDEAVLPNLVPKYRRQARLRSTPVPLATSPRHEQRNFQEGLRLGRLRRENEAVSLRSPGAETYFRNRNDSSTDHRRPRPRHHESRSMLSKGEGDSSAGWSTLGKHIEILKKFGCQTIRRHHRFP